MGVRRLDFMCVGFAKSGTTTLYHVLSQHPQIYLSKIKEPVFWNDETALQRGKLWYLSRYYKEALSSQITGEINPQITNLGMHELIIKKVLKKNGKIVFIMRNPIERLYSHFFMDLLWGSFHKIHSDDELVNYDRIFDKFVDQAFEKFCTGIGDDVYKIDEFAFGNYVYYLDVYSKLFGKENVFVLIFEEFIQNIQSSCRELFDFLNIDKDVNLDFQIKSNEGNYLPRNIMCMMVNGTWNDKVWPFICRNFDINQKIDLFMDRKLNWGMRSNKILLKPTSRKKMSFRTRKHLESIFAPEIQKVEEFLGYSLKGIWYRIPDSREVK